MTNDTADGPSRSASWHNSLKATMVGCQRPALSHTASYSMARATVLLTAHARRPNVRPGHTSRSALCPTAMQRQDRAPPLPSQLPVAFPNSSGCPQRAGHTTRRRRRCRRRRPPTPAPAVCQAAPPPAPHPRCRACASRYSFKPSTVLKDPGQQPVGHAVDATVCWQCSVNTRHDRVWVKLTCAGC